MLLHCSLIDRWDFLVEYHKPARWVKWYCCHFVGWKSIEKIMIWLKLTVIMNAREFSISIFVHTSVLSNDQQFSTVFNRHMESAGWSFQWNYHALHLWQSKNSRSYRNRYFMTLFLSREPFDSLREFWKFLRVCCRSLDQNSTLELKLTLHTRREIVGKFEYVWRSETIIKCFETCWNSSNFFEVLIELWIRINKKWERSTVPKCSKTLKKPKNRW